MNLDDFLFSLLEKGVLNGIIREDPDLLASLVPNLPRGPEYIGTAVSSILSLLDYLGVIQRTHGLIRLLEPGKSLWKSLNPTRRCMKLIKLLRSKHEGFSKLIDALLRVGQVSRNRLRIYSGTFLHWDYALMGLLWMEDCGLINPDGSGGYRLTEMGYRLLPEALDQDEEREVRIPCPFSSHLEAFVSFTSTDEYESLRRRKEHLIRLGRALKASATKDELTLRAILEQFISAAFTMEWARDSLADYLKELTSDVYVLSIKRFLAEVAGRDFELPKAKIASPMLEIFSDRMAPLATELLTAMYPERFGVYDEVIYRLITNQDDLELEIFNRQAPHYEGLSTEYYLDYCNFVREVRKCLSKRVEGVDNLDAYLFLRYVEGREGRREGDAAEVAVGPEGGGEQLILAGDTGEILEELGLSYAKFAIEGESPELSDITFGERFPWLERSGEKGRSLIGLRMYRHQLDVDEALASGRNVILISGTGSGKTESWVLHALNEGKKVMAIYPTLALSGDQEQRMRDYFEAVGSEKVFKVDAKVVREYRRKRDRRLLKKRINMSKLIITNPAFLMSDLKRMAVGEGYLERFLQDADLIVVDELDYYGSSGASLLIGGLLDLLYGHFLTGKKPQIVILTATLGNPDEVGEALTRLNGRETSIIEGRPFRLTNVIYLLLDREAEVKLASLLASLVRSEDPGVTLVFTQSIKEAEQIARRVRANLPEDMQDLVRAHHHLVSKEERARIEESARKGELRLISTPRTLIQGIDIGTVRRVVHYGLPMDIREFRQREGRKGRRRELGSSETIILPIRKWDHRLMEGGPDFLMKWASLPPERIVVNPGNKYVKLFHSLYKVKSPFLSSRVEEDERELLTDLGLFKRVEVEGMLLDDLTEEALTKVWRNLNFYGYGPPYGYRRYHFRSKELLTEEEVSLSDLVEKFQPGCIDYSTSMIVIRLSKGTAILEDDLYFLENSRLDVGSAVRSFKAEYERIKRQWGEEPNFYRDFQYGRIFSRVDLLVRPPKGSFGLLREIPLSVRWIVEGEGTKPTEFDGVVRERFLSRSVELRTRTTGIYSFYTYGRSYSLDPLEDVMSLRLGMSFLISLLKLELNLSPNLVRYAFVHSYTSSQLVVWEPNPVGVMEMPSLWSALRRAVETHEPDHLTKIYMWAVDREVVDLMMDEIGWERIKELALRALDYIEGAFVEMPLPSKLVLEPADAKVASLELVDLSPIIPTEKSLAVIFDGMEYRYFELPRLENLMRGELSDGDLSSLYSFFDVLDSLVKEGFRIVHFGRRNELSRICSSLGTFTEIKCGNWRESGSVIDLHEDLVRSLGTDIVPIDRVEGIVDGLPERRVGLDDLIESYSGGEGDGLLLLREYAKENARSIRSLYLALKEGGGH